MGLTGEWGFKRAAESGLIVDITLRVTLLLLTVALTLLASLAPVTAHASQNQMVTFEAPRDLLNAKSRGQTFTELDSLGVRALRIVMYWKDVAPRPLSRMRPPFDGTDPAAYNWSKYAPAIEEANRRGWSVLLTISGPVPIWASNGATNETYDPRPKEFQAFATAVSRRFSKYINRYSIYNEPNHPKFLTPQFDSRGNPVSPKLYRTLFIAARRGFAANNDTKPVIMGETSPRGTRDAMAPLRFLREALCLTPKYVRLSTCDPFQVDGWATHPYTAKTPYLKRVPKDDVTIGTLSRLTRALDRAATAGAVSRNLPIYLTEFGMQSKPDPIFGLSPMRQAEYRSIAELISWKNPRIVSFAQYLLRDDLPRRAKKKSEKFAGFETGLRASNGRVKPSLAAFRLPLVIAKNGGKASLWGLVRPGTGKRTVIVESTAGGGWSKIAVVTTDANGYWHLGSTAVRGRKWRVRATVDGKTFMGPPTRAYRGAP